MAKKTSVKQGKVQRLVGFSDLSEDAQSTAKGMIQYCIECGYRMGMDEGFESFDPEVKHKFRLELEAFCGMKPNVNHEFHEN